MGADAGAPNPGAAATAVNVASKRRFRRIVIVPSLSGLRQQLWRMLHRLPVRLKEVLAAGSPSRSSRMK
jgi:hypothetical protein